MSVSARRFADPRISRRRKAVERTRRRRIVWRCSVAALIALLIWAAFLSPFLKVKKVRVSGGRHTTSEEIARAAGLDSADNLLLLSTSSIAADAARLPWVKSVEVERKLPGTVKVRVTERKPMMVLAAEGRRWLLDSEGRVLGSEPGQERMPVIAGSPVDALEAGATVGDQEVTGALAVFSSMPRTLRTKVQAISAPTVERITLSLRDGTQVRYGAPHDLVSKNEVLGVLLRRLQEEGSRAASIDVRVPTSPAVSPVAPPAAPDPTPTSTP